MIFGIGNDIIEVDRIKNSINRNSLFAQKIFSESEINYCEAKGKSKFQSYAARFAVKESFMKAIGTGWRNGIKFNEIEIINDDLGKPTINLNGKSKEIVADLNISKIFVTISHIKEYAIAEVIIEK